MRGVVLLVRPAIAGIRMHHRESPGQQVDRQVMAPVEAGLVAGRLKQVRKRRVEQQSRVIAARGRARASV